MDLFARLQGESGRLCWTAAVGNSLPSISSCTDRDIQWVSAGAASICQRFRLRLMRGLRLEPKFSCCAVCAKSKASECLRGARAADFSRRLSEMICITAPKPGSTSSFFLAAAFIVRLPSDKALGGSTRLDWIFGRLKMSSISTCHKKKWKYLVTSFRNG